MKSSVNTGYAQYIYSLSRASIHLHFAAIYRQSSVIFSCGSTKNCQYISNTLIGVCINVLESNDASLFIWNVIILDGLISTNTNFDFSVGQSVWALTLHSKWKHPYFFFQIAFVTTFHISLRHFTLSNYLTLENVRICLLLNKISWYFKIIYNFIIIS